MKSGHSIHLKIPFENVTEETDNSLSSILLRLMGDGTYKSTNIIHGNRNYLVVDYTPHDTNPVSDFQHMLDAVKAFRNQYGEDDFIRLLFVMHRDYLEDKGRSDLADFVTGTHQALVEFARKRGSIN